ncbi:MAG: hypothetical protein ACFFD7_15555 [Candidatus Thorarchaeota archaeon]
MNSCGIFRTKPIIRLEEKLLSFLQIKKGLSFSPSELLLEFRCDRNAMYHALRNLRNEDKVIYFDGRYMCG